MRVPAVPVPTWFATINVARQPQIACLPLICLYIHSLLSFVYIDQNAIIECRVCVLVRDQPEFNTCPSTRQDLCYTYGDRHTGTRKSLGQAHTDMPYQIHCILKDNLLIIQFPACEMMMICLL